MEEKDVLNKSSNECLVCYEPTYNKIINCECHICEDCNLFWLCFIKSPEFNKDNHNINKDNDKKHKCNTKPLSHIQKLSPDCLPCPNYLNCGNTNISINKLLLKWKKLNMGINETCLLNTLFNNYLSSNTNKNDEIVICPNTSCNKPSYIQKNYYCTSDFNCPYCNSLIEVGEHYTYKSLQTKKDLLFEKISATADYILTAYNIKNIINYYFNHIYYIYDKQICIFCNAEYKLAVMKHNSNCIFVNCLVLTTLLIFILIGFMSFINYIPIYVHNSVFNLNTLAFIIDFVFSFVFYIIFINICPLVLNVMFKFLGFDYNSQILYTAGLYNIIKTTKIKKDLPITCFVNVLFLIFCIAVFSYFYKMKCFKYFLFFTSLYFQSLGLKKAYNNYDMTLGVVGNCKYNFIEFVKFIQNI